MADEGAVAARANPTDRSGVDLRDYPSVPGMRPAIGTLVLIVGLAGITWGLTSQFTVESFVIVAIASASTIPVAVGVYLYGKKLEWAPPFLLYADVGIIAVLFATGQFFDAMPGAILLLLGSLFAAVFTSDRILVAQLTLSVLVVVILGVLAVDQGVEALLVTSRALTLVSVAITPILVRMHMTYVRDKLETAQRDSVSDLFNRRGLDDAVERFEPARGATRTLGVVLVHIDDFENIERRSGRAASKELVLEMTSLLRQTPPTALLARTSESEFACVVAGSAGSVERDLATITARVDNAQLRSAAVSIKCTSSSVTVDHRTVMSNALGRALASAALDFYDGGDTEYAHVTQLLADGGPTIVFQPVVSVSTGRTMGYEALSRFPPGHGSTQTWFLDARAGGVQVQLELAAIRQAVQMSQHLVAGAFVAINVSALTIVAHDLVPDLEPASSTRQVVIEITEHDLVTDYTALGVALDHLRRAGLSISVDDVGAGYSGLRQLVEIKPDVVKLDASIVHGIDTDDMRRAAASALTTFAAAIGAQCVYEGIETQKQLDSARALGADMVQGFLIGRPAAVTSP